MMNKTATGSLYLILSTFFISAFNYLLSIILSWILEPAAYGQIGVTQNLIFLGSWFLIAGFPWVTVQTLAKYKPEEYTKTYAILKGTLWGNSLLGLLICGALWVGYQSGTLRLDTTYGSLILWVIITIFLIAVRMAFIAILQGTLRFGELGFARSFEVVIQFLSAILFVMMGYGAEGALVGFATGTALSLFLTIWLARDIPFWQSTGFDKETVLTLRPAIPFLLANIGGVLLVNIDLLALKFLANPVTSDTLVGHYQAATVLVRIPYYISQSLISILFPLIARQTHDIDLATQTSKQALMLKSSFVLCINIIFIAAPEAVISFFFPAQYLTAAPTLRMLAIAMSFIVLTQTLVTILQARGQNWQPALILPLAVVVQVGTALWLIPNYGLMGAALSSTIAAIAAFLMILMATQMRFPALLRLPRRDLVVQTGAFLLLGLIVYGIPQVSRPITALWLVVSGLLYIGFLFKTQLIDISTLRGMIQKT